MNDIFLKLRKELLNEAVDLDSGDAILKTFQRGQIIGVKYKEFGLKEEKDLSRFIQIINQTILPSIKEVIQSPSDLNKYVMLFLKKAKNFNTLNRLYGADIERILDSSSAYFGNINKREVKENPEVQKRFTDFYNSPYDATKDLAFERWANEMFAQKATMKAGDVKQIYNKGGWEIVQPLTFAAAKQYACMNNRKATWCTSARSSFFDSYSSKGKNPLYIIRNKEKNLMYQMDFGEGGRHPNFKKEDDNSITIEEALLQIPKDVLDALKDSEGKSVASLFKDEVKENKGITKSEEWKETIFTSVEEFEKEIEPFQKPDILKGGVFSKLTLETAIKKGTNINTISKLGKLTDGKKTFYYIFPTNNVRIKHKSREKVMGKFIFQLVGDRLLVRSFKGFLKLDLPRNIKAKFMDTEKETPEHQKEAEGPEFKKTEIGYITFYEGVNSIESLEKIESEKHLNNIKKLLIFERRDPKKNAVYGYNEKTKAPFMLYVNPNGSTDGGYFRHFTMNKALGEIIEMINLFKRNNLFGLNSLSQKEISNITEMYSNRNSVIMIKDYGEFRIYLIRKRHQVNSCSFEFGVKEEDYDRAMKNNAYPFTDSARNIASGDILTGSLTNVLRVIKSFAKPENINTVKSKIEDAIKVATRHKAVASLGFSIYGDTEKEIKKYLTPNQ